MTPRTTGIVILSAALLAVPLAAQRGPAPAGHGLPADVIGQACAPSIVYEPPPMPLRVTGGQDSFVRITYAPGDLITINAGTRNGIDVGQEFYTRRLLSGGRERISRRTPATVRTTGWIRVYAVDETMSLATITHVCDTIDVNDYLEPLVLPQAVVPSADRPKAQRENYGRVLVGADRRRAFGKDDFFVVDRGSDHGVAPGTQFVIYRDKRVDRNFLFELGEAFAVEVKPESSTLRITKTSDAVLAGDYVAMRR